MIQQILQITNFNNQLCAIVPFGDPIPLGDISGSPIKGATIDDETNTIVNSNADPDCMNGVCNLQLPEGK